MNDNDTPAECADCRSVPHDTLCDGCSRLVCYGCSVRDDGAQLCALCHADRCEERDSTAHVPPTCHLCRLPMSDGTDGHGLGECVPVCPECEGSGTVERCDWPGEHANRYQEPCPVCRPREPLQDGTGCDV